MALQARLDDIFPIRRKRKRAESADCMIINLTGPEKCLDVSHAMRGESAGQVGHVAWSKLIMRWSMRHWTGHSDVIDFSHGPTDGGEQKNREKKNAEMSENSHFWSKFPFLFSVVRVVRV
jgi:hypothetical protein